MFASAARPSLGLEILEIATERQLHTLDPKSTKFDTICCMSNRWSRSILFATLSAVVLGVLIGVLVSSLEVGASDKVESEGGKSRSLVLDLDQMLVILMEGERAVAALPLRSLPPEGSPWSIADGEHAVTNKEKTHTSPISRGSYENVIGVGGNIFFHADRESVRDGSPNILALFKQDAERLFSFAEVGTLVLVRGGKSATGERLQAAAQSAGLFVRQILAGGTPPPPINAKAYIIGDLDTGEVLWQKNEEQSLPIASITKLITTMVMRARMDPLMETTVSSRARATYGTQGNLEIGETLKVEELLYPLLLESSNDAAEVIAESMGRERFIVAMNDEASKLGLNATRLVDPSGLSPENVSTAKDLFALARHYYKDDKETLSLTTLLQHRAAGHRWINPNKLVRGGDERYLGGKTGYIPEAGLTSVALFSIPRGEFQRDNIAVILLRSANRDQDYARILDQLAPGAIYNWDKKTNAEQEGGEEKAHLIFVGDIMMDRGVEAKLKQNPSYSYDDLFNFTPRLKTADIAFGNLEGPASLVGYDLGNLYSFRMEPKALEALATAGFDVLSFANNHVGDWGRAAFEDTVVRARALGMGVAGAGLSTLEAREPIIVERHGIRFGYIAFSDVGPEWLTGPDGQPAMLSTANPLIKTIIERAARQVDHLIVSYHFGEEYEKSPNRRQRDLARRAINAGASIVVGHHPHVVQEVERYKGGVIAYSLGNFIFDQSFSKETMQGLALEVIASKTEIIDVRENIFKINDKYQPVIE